jgi:Flp pilus assembly protein protease CpaA
MAILAWCWALTTVAAWTDLRARIIPNALVFVGLGGALLAMVLGRLPWEHLLWAAGTWAAYELWQWRWPGTLGWGDVKWATVIMACLGGVGLFVLGMGHLGVTVGGTVRWGWHRLRRQPVPWRGQALPWAPGVWVGATMLGGIVMLLR